MKMNKVIIMGLLCGMSFGLQADATTPLMQASTLDQIKKLVEGGADVNAAIWQSEWRHYVTVLDNCIYWQQQTPSSELQAIIDYLKSVGAQTAGKSPYYTNNSKGDLVSGSQMGLTVEEMLAAQAAAQAAAATKAKAQAISLKDEIQDLQNKLNAPGCTQQQKDEFNQTLAYRKIQLHIAELQSETQNEAVSKQVQYLEKQLETMTPAVTDKIDEEINGLPYNYGKTEAQQSWNQLKQTGWRFKRSARSF